MEHTLTPAQWRTWRGLLAVGEPRPTTDPAAGTDLRRWMEAEVAEAAAAIPADRPLRISKSALAALDCDGRYLDLRATPFAHSPRTVLGTLAHRAIQLDTDSGRARDAGRLVRHAWDELASADGARHGWASAILARVGGIEGDALRADARTKVLAFRECFPPLPPDAAVRTEAAFVVRFAAGRILLRGVPDLVVGRATPTHRRMHLIDLKTGRRSDHHRRDARFYALAATLKLGIPPFRTSTYYLDEADWDTEEVTDDLLRATARDVVERIRRAARLEYRRPPDVDLGLAAGPACGWCSRAPTCPVAPPVATGARPFPQTPRSTPVLARTA